MYVYQSISYPHLSTVWGNFLRCLQMPSIIWPDTKKDNWLWPLSLVYLLEKIYIYIPCFLFLYIHTCFLIVYRGPFTWTALNGTTCGILDMWHLSGESNGGRG